VSDLVFEWSGIQAKHSLTTASQPFLTNGSSINVMESNWNGQ